MAATKFEVISVRVIPSITVALQLPAERETRSLANMGVIRVIACSRSKGYPVDGVAQVLLPNAISNP